MIRLQEVVIEWQREFSDSAEWRSAYAALKLVISTHMPPIQQPSGRVIASCAVRRRTVDSASYIVTTFPTGSEVCPKAELHPEVAAALAALHAVEGRERTVFMRRCALSDYIGRLRAEAAAEVENG